MHFVRIVLSGLVAFLAGLNFAHATGFERSEGLDYTLFAGGRSKPLGGAIYGEVGYDHSIWGDWRKSEPDQTNFAYGYLRPVLSLANAWSINSVDAAIQIYPISILGLTLGRAASYRLSDSSFSADCSQYQCDGSLRADYGRASLLLGAAGFFLKSETEWRDIESSGADQDFYEDSLALIGHRGHDRVFSQTHSLGYQVAEGVTPLHNLIVALNGKRSESLNYGSHSQRLSLAVAHQIENWKLMYVGGVYESSLQGLAPAIGFEVAWVGKNGLAY